MVYTWGDKKNGRIYDEERPYWTMNNDIGTIISVWAQHIRTGQHIPLSSVTSSTQQGGFLCRLSADKYVRHLQSKYNYSRPPVNKRWCSTPHCCLFTALCS